MRKELVRKSRFISLVLRHDPSVAGLTLDVNGWVGVDALLAGAEQAGIRVTPAELMEIVATNEKQRFAICEETGRIRANQGHSLAVDLGMRAQEPPAVLYHGTGAGSRDAMEREGIRRMKRQHVHLSGDVETAIVVGRRHGSPIVFRVDAARMSADGIAFYRSENGVWLVDEVKPVYLAGLAGAVGDQQ